MRQHLFGIPGLARLAMLPASAPATAQSVETVVFRVPVEATDIRYLSSVNVRCAIQDGTRGGPPLDREVWSNAHMISNLVSWRLWAPDFGRCTADPITEEAEQRCMTPGEDGGLSWSGVIEVPVRDFQNGNIRVAEAENYKCSAVVHFDTEPDVAGEATLQDGLCAGFYSNPFSIDDRERYQVFTGGDIAAAELCEEGRFSPVDGTMELSRQFVTGGEYTGDTGSPGEDAPETPAVINPDLAGRLPDTTTRTQVSEVARTRLTAPVRIATGTDNGSGVCHDAVQGQIAWNHTGNTQWADANVRALCAGAEDSRAPAVCFEQVMHGDVARPDGGRWDWREARDLCRGSRNAATQISCYEARIDAGDDLETAIGACHT